MRLVNRIVLATTNLDKYDEFRALLSAQPEPISGLELSLAQDVIRNSDGLQFAERHETYLDNAVAKARLVNMACHYPTLADDSGLEVTDLGGRPGVRSHRYATPKGGISQDQANIDLLLSELKGKGRSARFVCTLALLIEGILIQATGVLEGTLLEARRGDHGFGYDPVFVPKDATRTLAEMNQHEKNKISHRALALQSLVSQLKAHGIVIAKP